MLRHPIILWRERERDRKEGGRKGVSVGWDEMGVAVAAAVREVR